MFSATHLIGFAAGVRVFTGYTADQCTGGTPSASSELGAGNTAAKAFDNNVTTTLWATTNPFTNPSWLEYQFASPLHIMRYTLQCASSGSGTASQMPNTFKLQVHDGAGWVDLDSRSAQTWSLDEKKSYDVAEHGYTATRYRINITAINGGVVGEIGEMEMMAGVYS